MSEGHLVESFLHVNDNNSELSHFEALQVMHVLSFNISSKSSNRLSFVDVRAAEKYLVVKTA